MVRGWALAMLLALAARTATAETWDTYAALRNDAFSEALPPFDDVGFTHDNVFALRRQHGDLAFGGGFQHRWITSRIDRRRWDQVDLVARGEHAWPHRITTSARIGPTLGGNFGGRYLQNGWHSISGTGPTVDQGLANDYPGGRKIGLLAGLGARIEVGEELLRGFARVDGQLAGGAGVSSVDSTIGGSVVWRHVGAEAELALTRYHVADPNLALPGAYGSGWQLEWRAGVFVAWSRFRVSYQYRANEGGSGEPIGVIAFQSRR